MNNMTPDSPNNSEPPADTTLPPAEEYESAGASNSYVLRFGIFMLIGLVALAWIGRTPQATAVGEKLPPIDLQPLIDAEPISNQSLVGKVAVIHFWGTWCGPCRLEFPEFAKLVQRYRNDDRVAIISVSCSSGPEYDLDELAAETSEFLDEQSARMPIYADSTAMTRQQILLLLNGSLGYPTTIVVDKDGIIVDALPGYLPGAMEELSEKIQTYL